MSNGSSPSGEVHRLDETGQPEEMVAVEMGDEYPGDLHERDRRAHQLPLGPFTAIEQEYLRPDPDGHGAGVAIPGGHAAPCSEEDDLHAPCIDSQCIKLFCVVPVHPLVAEEEHDQAKCGHHGGDVHRPMISQD